MAMLPKTTPEKKRTKPVALTLAELQSQFQAAVMSGDDGILALIPDNSRTGKDVLLGVYRHAYVARLVEIVGGDFPTLLQLMGQDAFDVMAADYVRTHPSRRQNARWFSHELPEFLASSERYQSVPELADMARLERALADAFDAEDAPVMDISVLAAHPPEDWGALTFTAHPSAERLDLSTNVFHVWRALSNDECPDEIERLGENEKLVVWRNVATSNVRVLETEEAMMWDEAAKGVRFSVLCELAATYADPNGAALRAAQYLQGWISSGLLSRAELKITETRS
jgi:Putative DNA-binding domain